MAVEVPVEDASPRSLGRPLSVCVGLIVGIVGSSWAAAAAWDYWVTTVMPLFDDMMGPGAQSYYTDSWLWLVAGLLLAALGWWLTVSEKVVGRRLTLTASRLLGSVAWLLVADVSLQAFSLLKFVGMELFQERRFRTVMIEEYAIPILLGVLVGVFTLWVELRVTKQTDDQAV